jgi:hypothetical protein
MRFEDKIRLLAILFPLSVTSWLRSRKHNAQVGGVANSQHLAGVAVDVVLDDTNQTAEFINWAQQQHLQVIVEGDHLHVQEPRSQSGSPGIAFALSRPTRGSFLGD